MKAVYVALFSVFSASLPCLESALISTPGAEIRGNTGLVPSFFGGPPRPLGWADRSQFIYESKIFSDQEGPFLIRAMAFRLNEQFGGPFTYTNPDISIWLSTTTQTEASLDFFGLGDHVGNDAREVIKRGALQLASDGDFDKFSIILSFDEPFVYDPAAGNLLMDILNWDDRQGTGPGLENISLDANNTIGDGMARAFNYGPGDGTGGGADSIGLITQFVIRPIPEPDVKLLLPAAWIALLSRCRRMHRN